MKSLFFFILLTTCSQLAKGQSTSINKQALINDLHHTIYLDDNKHIIQAFWFPIETWKFFVQNSETHKASLEQIKENIKGYTFIAICEIKIDKLGFTQFSMESDLEEQLQLNFKDHTQLKFIKTEDLPYNTWEIVNTFESMLSKLLGEFGKHFNIYVFECPIEQGLVQIDPKEAGKIDLWVRSHKFTWELPLGSLLPPKICPKTNKEYQGNWNYCPIHGVELEESQKE